MSDTSTHKSLLEAVGGFDTYQNTIYSTILKTINKIGSENVLMVERNMERECPGYRVDGLTDGLLGLAQKQRPLTSRNIEDIDMSLTRLNNLFTKQLEPYVKPESYHPAGENSPRDLVKRWVNQQVNIANVRATLQRESDAIIEARRSAAQFS